MNPPQRNRARRRRSAGRHGAGVDVWRAADPLPDVEPIVIPEEVGALLRSLGDAPAIGGSAIAGQYFAAVVERAAAVARALAHSADLLADPDGNGR